MGKKAYVAEQFNYPADHVWAYAVAAHSINNGYLKEGNWGYDSEGKLIQTQTPNRSLVVAMLAASDAPAERYLKQGREYREFWQSQLLLLLDDRANSFVKSVVASASKDTIDTMLDLSIIVSCIASTDKSMQKQILNNRKLALDSKYCYSVGSSVNFTDNIEVIRCEYLDKVGAYAVESIIDGNFYSWWSKHKIECLHYKSLQARVKRLEIDFATKIPVTLLNYVKVN